MINTFILDTNLFFNLQSGLTWGKTSEEVIKAFTIFSSKLTSTSKATFYMTPGIVEEFKGFFDSEPNYVHDFLTTITITSPDLTKNVVGASIMREFVEEARTRAYRGMKVAEEEFDSVAKSMIGKEKLSNVDYQKQLGQVITKFRERFRHATRFNFIDSTSDFDLILLARQVNGALVSADEGVTRWGRLMGVTEIAPSQLRASLEALG